MSKYRIYELAKEFSTSSKTILDILDQKSISSEMNPKIIEFPLKYTSDILTAKR